jgi:hypothetical protein
MCSALAALARRLSLDEAKDLVTQLPTMLQPAHTLAARAQCRARQYR